MAKIDQYEPCPCESGRLFKDCHGPKVKTLSPPEIKERVALKVISEPDPNTRTVFQKNDGGPVLFTGYETNTALICGNCSANLVIGIPVQLLLNLVLRCNNCQAFNEI